MHAYQSAPAPKQRRWWSAVGLFVIQATITFAMSALVIYGVLTVVMSTPTHSSKITVHYTRADGSTFTQPMDEKDFSVLGCQGTKCEIIDHGGVFGWVEK